MAARTQTIDFLISRMEKLTDTEGDTHLSSAEKFEIMNSAIAETWDVICNSGMGEKYVTYANFSTVAGTLAYSLFTIAPTFFRIHQVYVLENGRMRSLKKISPTEVQTLAAPTGVVTMRLYYIPYSPVLTTGQSFDGINGWEEHTLMTACCAVKMKKEDDYRLYAARKQELERRIKTMGNTDFGEPMRVQRKHRRYREQDPFALFNSNINAYVLRGDNIELYSCSSSY